MTSLCAPSFPIRLSSLPPSRQISVCPESGCGLPIGGDYHDFLPNNTSVADMMAPLNVMDKIEEDLGYHRLYRFQYRFCDE